MPGIGHGTFRQATEQAFTHVRHFIAHMTASPDHSLQFGPPPRQTN
jgi:hypothetical protein